MAVSSGDQLGPYQILTPIGAGGMGEVYRAHDPRMGRDVALKLSQERFSERFDREVRAVAALSHPNICTIHDVGPNYYVMELVEGPTLEDRIAQGPIPLEEALEIAGQIAEALEAAHEKGIVHRDLKPANIKLKPDGTVKVLDFGLAKLAGSSEAAAPAGTIAATVTMGATQAGAILGTAAYMSPEQARGKTVDRRTDTWAFGAVLYEMLAGKPAFAGETITDVLAAVVQSDPDFKLVPEQVRPLLQRCLEKDPKRRLREPSDGLLLLEKDAQPIAPTSKRFGLISSAAAAVLLLALVALAFVHFREKPQPVETVRFQFALPPKVTFTQSGIFAVSPDGHKIAFSAFGADGVPRIWIRDVASLTAQPIPNVETPQALYALFWSPDSRFLAVQSGGKLKKIEISSGAAQDICDAPGPIFGGSWSRDGVILFADNPGRGIMRVPALGGTPVPVATMVKGENFLPIYPVFLPDGKHFLYSRGAGKDKRGIYAGSMDAKPEQQSRTPLVLSDYSFAYAPGHLLFLNGGNLLAQSFDEKHLSVAGEPVPVANPVAADDGPAFGHLSASASGSLVYLPATSRMWQLTWFNRKGEIIGRPVQTEEFRMLKLSPDGNKAAVERFQVFAGQSSIWVIDLVLGTNSRLTFGPGLNGAPVWSPDGTHIAWRALRGGKAAIYQKAANGTGNEELLYQYSNNAGTPALTDWSHDGRFLIFRQGSDIWALPVGPGSGSDRKPFPVIQSPEFKQGAYLSPDGRWLAYLSNESGRPEIYVQGVSLSSPNSGKWIVSKGSSGLARWRADNKELMFLSADGVLMAVPLAGGSVFQPSPWQTLFKLPPEFLRLTTNPGVLADVTRDNQKILLSMPVEGSGQELSVVLNWEAGVAHQ
ncbi:MAG TPA: protein kinase [Bryobacteraceae bacterium]|jgi:Tol biopolymer transport system component